MVLECCEASSEKRLHCLSLVDARKLENGFASGATIDLKASTTLKFQTRCKASLDAA